MNHRSMSRANAQDKKKLHSPRRLDYLVHPSASSCKSSCSLPATPSYLRIRYRCIQSMRGLWPRQEAKRWSQLNRYLFRRESRERAESHGATCTCAVDVRTTHSTNLPYTMFTERYRLYTYRASKLQRSRTDSCTPSSSSSGGCYLGQRSSRRLSQVVVSTCSRHRLGPSARSTAPPTAPGWAPTLAWGRSWARATER